MTRCVFQNDSGSNVAVSIETREADEDFPTGGVVVTMQSGVCKEIDSALDRKEADVLLHLLAHALGYTLVDRRHARLIPAHIQSPRKRRRPF